MNDFVFTSLSELYNKVLPALKTKRQEMALEGLKNISEKTIFKYLCENVWSKKSDLSLGVLVDDILNTKSMEIYSNTRSDDNG